MNIRQTFGLEAMRAGAMPMPNSMPGRAVAGNTKRPGNSFQQDDTSVATPGQNGPQQNGGPGAPGQQGQFEQDPALTAAPYVKLLTKLGYEYQGGDQDVEGNPIGNSFQGPDGDMIYVKQDGSWVRFGPGAQRAQGPDVNSLGQNLVRNALQQGDNENHHSALRQAGYQKIHQDDQGNSYYKHPQTNRTVTVSKDGKWNSSVGSGRGAGKLRGFLGDEQMQDQDPQMQKMKMQQQQMKQQQAGMKQQGMQQKRPGTRGNMGTRGI